MEKFRIETPFGEGQIIVNGGNTCIVRFGELQSYHSDAVAPATINRVDYSVNAHLKYSGGEWTVGMLFGNRMDWKNASYHANEMSPAAKRKVRDELPKIVAEFAKTHAEAFGRADAENRADEVSRIEHQIENKNTEIRELKAELAEITGTA